MTPNSNSVATTTLLMLMKYEELLVPLIAFFTFLTNTKNKAIYTMSTEEKSQDMQKRNSQTDTVNSNSTITEVASSVDQSTTEFKSSVEERKNSVHSFRVIDSQQDSDFDKDLIIHSLNESLHIHKEILERIQNEKEEYQQQIEREREEEREKAENWKNESQRVMNEQSARCGQLEASINALRHELEVKKEEYSKLEVNFYSYVKTIRVTDDDLSTIQPEISHLLSQLNNTCMGLKSKMNREGGTQFVYKYWSDKTDLIKKYMLPANSKDDDLLDTSYITLFVEKYLINTLLTSVLDVPIHLGVSINDAFQELDGWMETRNKEWSNRLRQQVCALVVQQPGDEENRINEAKQNLLEEIVSVLAPVYPPLKNDPKKIENLIQRAAKLNLAVKGQEIKIERLHIDEGVTHFDPETMKATAKGKPNGLVFLAITPPFVARDELDNEHGFTVPGKVFCVEIEKEKEKEEEEEHEAEKEMIEEEEEAEKTLVKDEKKEEVEKMEVDEEETKEDTSKRQKVESKESDKKEEEKVEEDNTKVEAIKEDEN